MFRPHNLLIWLTFGAILLYHSISYGELVSYRYNFNPDSVFVDTVQIAGENYIILSLTGCPAEHQYIALTEDSLGLPMLPCTNINAAIPFNHRAVSISYSANYIPFGQFPDIYIIPSQPNPPDSNMTSFVADSLVYQTLIDYPSDENVAKIVNARGVYENLAMTATRIIPFKYNAINGEVQIISSIDVTIQTAINPSSMGSPDTMRLAWNTQFPYYFDELKRKMVINPENIESFSAPLELIDIGEDYWVYELVVVEDSHFNLHARDYCEHRTDGCRPAEFLTVAEIDDMHGGDMDIPSKIRLTIQDYYNSRGTRAVMFIDKTNIRYLSINADTSFYKLYNGNNAYYGDMTRADNQWNYDGDEIWGELVDDYPDLVPEVYVGIVPAEYSFQCRNYVDKVRAYDYNGPGANLWAFVTSADMGRDLGCYRDAIRHLPDYIQIDTSLLETPRGSHPNPTYPYGEDIINTIFTNRLWCGAFEGHNNPSVNGFVALSSGMYPVPGSYILSEVTTEYTGNPGDGYIGNLEYTDNLFVLWNNSCLAGSYDVFVNCLASGLMFVRNGGTIINFSRSRISLGWEGAYMTSKYWQLWFNNYSNPDSLMLSYSSGSSYNMDVVCYHDSMEFIQEIYGGNLFGSPSIGLYTNIPEEIFVQDLPESIEYGETITFDHPVVDGNNTPLDNVSIAIRQGNRLRYGITDIQGIMRDKDTQIIEWWANSYQNIYITASAFWKVENHNYLTKQYVINVQGNDPGHISGKSQLGDSLFIPSVYAFNTPYPNPFNSSTLLKYQLPEESWVEISVYNLNGQLIESITHENKEPGYYSERIEMSDYSSGVYFVRFNADGFSDSKKLVLIK